MKVAGKMLRKVQIGGNVNNTDLYGETGMSSVAIATPTRGDDVKTSVPTLVCEVLGCNVGDVMDGVHDEEALQAELDRLHASGELTDEMLAALGKQHLRTPYR